MDQEDSVRAVFDRYATAYRDRFMDVTPYAAALALWIAELPKDARVLDLACGPGNLSRFVLDRMPRARLTGVDLSPRMVTLARAANPEGTFLVGDVRRACAPTARWDGILCGGCLPYLSESGGTELIAAMHQALSPGGLLYLSALAASETQSTVRESKDANTPSLEMRYYASEDLRSRVLAAGFELLECQPVDGAAEPGETQLIARRRDPLAVERL